MPPNSIKAAQDRFVAVWGQMGSAWGISRTMAEVHALLYITGEPLCTDDIMERLQISRGNASMSMRALLDWGIVERVHRRGDRKEYFKAEGDVWAMFRAIVRERMKREVDPLRAQLYEIRDQTGERAGERAPRDQGADLLAHNRRLDELLRFFQTLEGVSNSFVSPAGRGLQAAAKILGYIGGGVGNSAAAGAGPSTEATDTKEAG
ncbi:MAG: ArsR family transcriptional regulator [Phycisphaerae bacterium]|nr:ArsR family transcriptional regulator [Phycisphaerae bacterium]